MRKHRFNLIILLILCIFLSGCGQEKQTAFEISDVEGTRDSVPVCLVPEASGKETISGDTFLLDYSNADKGYIMASYTGNCAKVKFQITDPEGTTYTYNLTDHADAFPLSSQSGSYTFGIYENVEGKAYSTLMSETLDINITDIFGAYLYPNQYVNFREDSKTIAMGQRLAFSADTDLDVVSNVYNYMITYISYDKEKAETVQNGYLPDIDETLDSGIGICLDYAAVMAAMLRSQQIPTHLEVGYAGTAYHAWISTYIEDIGWVNGIIEFNGSEWKLMDPTFGASNSSKDLKKFIGDGSNYVVKYIY